MRKLFYIALIVCSSLLVIPTACSQLSGAFSQKSPQDNQAIKLNPNNAYVYNNRGNTY
jgi:hypothetical protein